MEELVGFLWMKHIAFIPRELLFFKTLKIFGKKKESNLHRVK